MRFAIFATEILCPMKIFTFFNEKGGTGKTTLSVMFASWLAYCQKETVRVVDCDYPSYQLSRMRTEELAYIREDPMSALARMSVENVPYPINRAMSKEAFTPSELAKIASEIQRQCSSQGYMLPLCLSRLYLHGQRMVL